MSAVLILAGSHAIPLSFTASVVAFGIVIAAMLSACWQWIASAKTKREAVKKSVALAAVVGAFVMIAFDCGWLGIWCLFV